jgi:hypothetical protein
MESLFRMKLRKTEMGMLHRKGQTGVANPRLECNWAEMVESPSGEKTAIFLVS